MTAVATEPFVRKRRRHLAAAVLVGALLCSGCSDAPPEAGPRAPGSSVGEPSGTPGLSAGSDSLAERPEGVVGETVYVPVYSHIFFQDGSRQIDLAVTLSVRNTDAGRPLVMTAIDYFDSEGRLVRRYLDQPTTLSPLASRAYVVDERDRTGGVGANFLVTWEAASEVSEPIVEAVMISTASNQGISFVSRGQTVGPGARVDAVNSLPRGSASTAADSGAEGT